MTQQDIYDILKSSIAELYERDAILLKKDYDIHERTVCHRLAIYIERNLKEDYHVDVEYNRMRTKYGSDDIGDVIGKILNWEDSGEGSSFVYPDIIIHKRDTEQNIVDIEVKMAWKNKLKKLDYQKINNYIKQLNYQFGVYVELSENQKNSKIDFGPFLTV